MYRVLLPTLVMGEKVLVNKLLMGMRIYTASRGTEYVQEYWI